MSMKPTGGMPKGVNHQSRGVNQTNTSLEIEKSNNKRTSSRINHNNQDHHSYGSRSRSSSSVSSMRSSSSGGDGGSNNSSPHHHHHHHSHHHQTHHRPRSSIKTGSAASMSSSSHQIVTSSASSSTHLPSQTPPPPGSSSSSYNQKLFVCSVCSAKFHVVDQINEHFVASHYQEYQRELSSKSPPRNTNVAQQNEEWRLSDPHNPLKCIKCDFVGRWPTELQKHAASHSTSRPFKCLICSLTYKWRWDLAKHFDRTHPTFRNPYKKRDRDAARNTVVPGGHNDDSMNQSSSRRSKMRSRSRSNDEDNGASHSDNDNDNDNDNDDEMMMVYGARKVKGGNEMAANAAADSFMSNSHSRSPSPAPSDDLNNHHGQQQEFNQRVSFYYHNLC